MIQSVTFGLTMACAIVLFGLGVYYVFMYFIVLDHLFSIKNAAANKKHKRSMQI